MLTKKICKKIRLFSEKSNLNVVHSLISSKWPKCTRKNNQHQFAVKCGRLVGFFIGFLYCVALSEIAFTKKYCKNFSFDNNSNVKSEYGLKKI